MDCVILFFFQAEDGIRDIGVTGVQTCALPIYREDAEVDAPAPQLAKAFGPARDADGLLARVDEREPARRDHHRERDYEGLYARLRDDEPVHEPERRREPYPCEERDQNSLPREARSGHRRDRDERADREVYAAR